MRLIHTADWQIGKVFRFVDQATMGVLQEARLEAISAIGRLALEHAAPIVLVAGDIYDIATAEDRTLAQPLARMRAFAGVEWHLIPGNHDPHQPGGPWERLLQSRPAGERAGAPRADARRARGRRSAAAAGAARSPPRARRSDRLDGPGAHARGHDPDRPRARLDQRLRLGRAHASRT